MGRSSQFCMRFASHSWTDVGHDHWATHKCDRALCKVCRQYGRSILQQLHSDENLKIMHIQKRFIRLDLPSVCHHYGGSRSLQSFQLSWAQISRSMCMEDPESITKYLSLPCVPAFPSFGKKVKGVFWLLFWVSEHPLQVPRRLFGRTAPVFGFCLAFIPQIWEPMDFALEVRTFEWFPAMDPSFPEFLRGAMCPCRIWRCDSIPTFHFPAKRLSLKAIMGHTTQLNTLFQYSNRSFAPPVFDFLLGCPPASVCRKLHLSPHWQSRFRLVIQANGMVPEITRRFCASSSKIFFTRSFAFQSWRTFSSQVAIFVRLSSVSLCRRFWSRKWWLCPLTRMRDPWLKTRGVSSWKLSVSLPLEAFSHFSFRADVSPFLTLDQYSCFNSFIPGFEISCPYRLINITIGLNFDNLAPRDPDSIFGSTLQILSEVVENMVIRFCANLPKHFRRHLTSCS